MDAEDLYSNSVYIFNKHTRGKKYNWQFRMTFPLILSRCFARGQLILNFLSRPRAIKDWTLLIAWCHHSEKTSKLGFVLRMLMALARINQDVDGFEQPEDNLKCAHDAHSDEKAQCAPCNKKIS